MPKRKKRYPNQQAVTVHKKNSHDKSGYFMLDKSKNNKAMRDLSDVAYKMYVYLCQYQNNTTNLLSCAEFTKITGLSKASYVSAKKELLKKYYLIQREDGDYDFYNYPNKPLTEQEKIINEIAYKYNEKETSE